MLKKIKVATLWEEKKKKKKNLNFFNKINYYYFNLMWKKKMLCLCALGSVWVCDFKMCDLKKVIFKNAVKRLAKSQFSL
jgi:hypothetical protein